MVRASRPTETSPLATDGRPQELKTASIAVRQGFVRKVYALLSAQLLLTVAIAGPIQLLSVQWMNNNSWLMIMSVIMTIVMMCAMSCCQHLTREFPTNYLLLFTFTAFEGLLVGFVSATYTWQSVLVAAAITVAVFLGLTIYATVTTTDFTGSKPYFMGLLLVFSMFGLAFFIMSLCGIYIKWMIMLYDCIGCIIFTVFIIADTQMILGEMGGHTNQFSVDDYVFASLNLYMDIIQLFMHLLRLIGERKQ
jgi:hypothetical protein